MRDLLNILETLSEAKPIGLSAGEINKYEKRFNTFIEFIKGRKPFTMIDGETVILDPREAKRFQELYDNGQFKGALSARTTDGEQLPLSKLAKTLEFGGASVAAGQDPTLAGKEALLVKPSQIQITDKDIPASDLYDVIASNPVLNSTDYGKVIIQLATDIVSGNPVVLPPEYKSKDKEKLRKAIVDYAGEYLGVLALISDRSRFPRKAQFEQWLGSSTSSLIINFPSKANTNLADSYATIKNPKTSHVLNISSKGTGGGAAPAISGLKVPSMMRDDPNFEDAIEFIDICQQKGTIPQAFDALDLLYKANKKALNKKWLPFLPFARKHPDLEALSKESIDAMKHREYIGLDEKYDVLYDDIKAGDTASDGGKLVYAIKKEVADAINKRDALPEFKDAVLQILEMNFIQQYADYKGGEILFSTQWPAKLDGLISVENKSSSKDPTAGGFSFKLGRTDDSVSSEPGEPLVTPTVSKAKFTATAADIINPKRKSEKEKPKVGGVGRELRSRK
jgi:hypothetical protein